MSRSLGTKTSILSKKHNYHDCRLIVWAVFSLCFPEEDGSFHGRNNLLARAHVFLLNVNDIHYS